MTQETVHNEMPTFEKNKNVDFHRTQIEICVSELRTNPACVDKSDDELLCLAESIIEFSLVLYRVWSDNNAVK